MTVKPLVHEIRIQNQVIFLDPPIEQARASWIHQLHKWLGEGSSSVLFGSRSLPAVPRCRLSTTANTKLTV